MTRKKLGVFIVGIGVLLLLAGLYLRDRRVDPQGGMCTYDDLDYSIGAIVKTPDGRIQCTARGWVTLEEFNRKPKPEKVTPR